MKKVTIIVFLLTISLVSTGQTVVTLNFPDPCSCDNSVLNEQLNLQHVVLPEATDTCFGATQIIIVGEIGAPYLMQQGSNAVMIAGERIVFKPQTTIHPGSYLHAYIAPAGPFCDFQMKHFLESENIIAGTGQNENQPETTFDELLFRLYPNPTSGPLHIDLFITSSSLTPVLEVYDMLGNRVEVVYLNNQPRQTISLSGLPRGIYIVCVTSGELRKYERIIKL